MSMKTARLRTYWAPGDAELMINFLDDIREMLVEAYGDEIIKMHQSITDKENVEDTSTKDSQTDLPFDDQIEF